MSNMSWGAVRCLCSWRWRRGDACEAISWLPRRHACAHVGRHGETVMTCAGKTFICVCTNVWFLQRHVDVWQDISYAYNGTGENVAAISGADVVESIIAQWKEYEMCSIEDPLHVQDITHLRLLKSVSAPRNRPPSSDTFYTCIFFDAAAPFSSCAIVWDSAWRRLWTLCERTEGTERCSTLSVALAATKLAGSRWLLTAPAKLLRKCDCWLMKLFSIPSRHVNEYE